MIKVIDNLVEKIKHGVGLSLNEGFEVVRRKKQQNKDTKVAHDRKEFPIHYSKIEDVPQMGQQKYLQYALGFIKKEYPLYHNLLSARMMGQSLKQITKFLNSKGYNVTEAEVSKKEAEAMRCVRQAINRVRQNGIPIFEGASAN